MLKLGDERYSSFWKRPWAGEGCLRDRFPRLFYLSANAEARVAEMGRWVDGRWRWELGELGWRRNILEREKSMVEELHAMLQSIELREGVAHQWRWGSSNNGLFSIKAAYGLIEKENLNVNPTGRAGGMQGRIWKVLALLKAQITTWRALRDRLPNRDSLAKRLVVPLDQWNCCCCYHQVESGEHFYLRCCETEKVWGKMVNWIGVRWEAPRGLLQHFYGVLGFAWR